MLTELTVKGLLAETAGDAPVPGGGSISALNGAIAAALAEMVANLTIGKKKYADVQDEMAEIAKSAAALQKELVLDVDRDSEAYDGVSQAFKLPKETDEEKAIRSAAIQENTKKAAGLHFNFGSTLFGMRYANHPVERLVKRPLSSRLTRPHTQADISTRYHAPLS
mgnify:CR=1 FL=1